MQPYTAEDGLRLLEYLNAPLLPTQKRTERKLFKKHWNRAYHDNNDDVIATTHALYTNLLPPLLAPHNGEAEQLARVRDIRFSIATRRAHLAQKLRNGTPLETILNEPKY